MHHLIPSYIIPHIIIQHTKNFIFTIFENFIVNYQHFEIYI